MGRVLETFFAPPLGACRYGCGGSCAAPAAVFWLLGIIGIVSGFFGGPAGTVAISWATIGAGVLMWLIAAVWALVTQAFGHWSCEQTRHASK